MWTGLVKLLGGVRATVFAAVALAALLAVGVQSHRLTVAKMALELVAADASASKRVNKALEARAEAEIADIRAKLKESTDAATAERDRLLADIAAGRQRLRQRFTCPAAPGAAAGPGGSVGAGEGGLLVADADFLVRFAADADRVVEKLNACQAIVEADRR